MAIELYNDGEHICLMFEDLVDDSSDAIQANQFLIVTGGEGALIDPAGNMTYSSLLMAMSRYFPARDLKYILASHADPDIVGSLNKWMVSSQCSLVVSKLWGRFVPHFCTSGNLSGRIINLPDEGGYITLGNSRIAAIPAHFLHAEGNFQFYDERSKILFSGDMGASMVHHDSVSRPITTVEEFKQHLKTMEGFHRRYMVSNKICRLWVHMVRSMDITWLVPQHGRSFKGKVAINAFLDWIEHLECGVDLMTQTNYRAPA
ncbi:MBL fold metallo-hydrolase [Chitinivorax sp. B]|uniref:MBL fold metallo-hydrolase n=1 Tax=Chitinivorax sp. B TaxID=2502235 RepID=UPI0010F6EE3C|nr:MBL fold metallo-hydrolase [Chitinivorax sp. B]